MSGAVTDTLPLQQLRKDRAAAVRMTRALSCDWSQPARAIIADFLYDAL
jgi:hypothetical protein